MFLLLFVVGPVRAGDDAVVAAATALASADGLIVIDGSYVMNVGELHVNITNFGLIGSYAPATCSFCDAPSAQWPAGSGVEYLFGAGLWVGGVLCGQQMVSTGQPEMEIRAETGVRATLYEARGGEVVRPTGNTSAGGRRFPDIDPDDDGDFLEDEEFLNGYDDDEDGRIDEDFAQIGSQMIVCTMYDNTGMATELYPDHQPMDLKIDQSAYAFESDAIDDCVALDYLITNVGTATVEDMYVGIYADPDIGPRDRPNRKDDDMAGSYSGWVQVFDETWIPVSLAYMYDDDGDEGQTPGYIGVVILGYDKDPRGQAAPRNVSMNAFRIFSGLRPFEQGGEPSNDAERYEVMSQTRIMHDIAEGREGDYRFLISAGPFTSLAPGESLGFVAALVVGRGLEGLLRNAAETTLAYYGEYFDLDGDARTGRYGRESRICERDMQDGEIYEMVADMMDKSCVPYEIYMAMPRISRSDLDGDRCIWVNMDNCFECGRQAGTECTPDNRYIETIWNCSSTLATDAEKKGCTGIGGEESPVNWIVGVAPPPPGMRVRPGQRSVHVYWDDRSEMTPDIRSNQLDFESYRIWRADNWDRPYGTSVENGPASALWQLIGEYDVVNSYLEHLELTDGSVVVDTLPLGANTGFDPIRYVPACLSDPRFEMPEPGLAEAMRRVVEADTLGVFTERPSLYDSELNVVEEVAALLPWQGYPTVLDTFFWTTPREAAAPTHVSKAATRFYEYVDRDVHNGFLYFYSVTATDHEIFTHTDQTVDLLGPGLAGSPSASFEVVRPGTQAQTIEDRIGRGVDIYVYPDPATREALEEFQSLHPDSDDPTGVRVCFANLPEAENVVEIYTLDGDLVQTLDHDGTGGYGEICWNLVSRNGQQVASGIYLYSVVSRDRRFDDFLGKFVVIR